MTAKINL